MEGSHRSHFKTVKALILVDSIIIIVIIPSAGIFESTIMKTIIILKAFSNERELLVNLWQNSQYLCRSFCDEVSPGSSRAMFVTVKLMLSESWHFFGEYF